MQDLLSSAAYVSMRWGGMCGSQVAWSSQCAWCDAMDWQQSATGFGDVMCCRPEAYDGFTLM